MRFLPMFLLLILTLFLLESCSSKNEETPPSVIPFIEFKSLNQYAGYEGQSIKVRYDSLTIAITYADGDSDLGLAPSDTMPPHRLRNPDGTGNKFYNCYFMELFRKEKGVFKPVVFDYISFSSSVLMYRFPPTGNKGGVKIGNKYSYFEIQAYSPYRGEIVLKHLLYPGIDDRPSYLSYGDTLKWRIQIADRALNLSNTVESSEFIFGR